MEVALGDRLSAGDGLRAFPNLNNSVILLHLPGVFHFPFVSKHCGHCFASLGRAGDSWGGEGWLSPAVPRAGELPLSPLGHVGQQEPAQASAEPPEKSLGSKPSPGTLSGTLVWELV